MSEGRLFVSARLTLGWVCLGPAATAWVSGVWDQQGHALLEATAEAQDSRQRHIASLESGLRMGIWLLPTLPQTPALQDQAQVWVPGRAWAWWLLLVATDHTA